MTARALRRLSSRLRRDTRGATIVEFAMVAPVMCLILLAGFDIAHSLYARAVLQGIVQKAGRDSALETGAADMTQAAIDERVMGQAKALQNNATVLITRRYYRTFTEVSAQRAEDWTDTNGNGRCDAGEPYEDANQNATWDSDGGNAGQGGAKDATLYTVTMTYPRMFPAYRYLGGSSNAVIRAVTVLRNQPYDAQQAYAAPTVRNCI